MTSSYMKTSQDAWEAVRGCSSHLWMFDSVFGRSVTHHSLALPSNHLKCFQKSHPPSKVESVPSLPICK